MPLAKRLAPRSRSGRRLPRRTRVAAALGLVSSAVAILGCAAEDAIRVDAYAALPRDGRPTVFLLATRERARIARSLRGAGVRVAEDILDSPLRLRVTLGSAKAWKNCGTLANVRYELSRERTPLLGMTGRGWTGACEPNVLDAMSARLRQELDRGATPRTGEED